MLFERINTIKAVYYPSIAASNVGDEDVDFKVISVGQVFSPKHAAIENATDPNDRAMGRNKFFASETKLLFASGPKKIS